MRVANELGRGNARAANLSVKVAVSTSVSIGVFFWILCLAFGRQIAYLFTNEKEVADAVSHLSLLFILDFFFKIILAIKIIRITIFSFIF